MRKCLKHDLGKPWLACTCGKQHENTISTRTKQLQIAADWWFNRTNLDPLEIRWEKRPIFLWKSKRVPLRAAFVVDRDNPKYHWISFFPVTVKEYIRVCAEMGHVFNREWNERPLEEILFEELRHYWQFKTHWIPRSTSITPEEHEKDPVEVEAKKLAHEDYLAWLVFKSESEQNPWFSESGNNEVATGR